MRAAPPFCAPPPPRRPAGHRKHEQRSAMNPTVSTISEAKRAANKANSAASTGPRTPEGKNRSRYNRLGHGLASPIAVLPYENQDEYDHLLSAFVDDYRPQTSVEEALVKQIADA